MRLRHRRRIHAHRVGSHHRAVGGGVLQPGDQCLEHGHPLRTARFALAAAAAPCPPGQTGTCVYAVGGENGGMYQNAAEVYNPVNNSWSTLMAMPTRREYLGAAAAACPPGQSGICVYAVGGFGAGFLSLVESYNPATNAWSPVASMPTARGSAATAAGTCPPGQSGTCIYAVGGLGVVNGPRWAASSRTTPPRTSGRTCLRCRLLAPASPRPPCRARWAWAATASTHRVVRPPSAHPLAPWKPSTLRTRRSSDPDAWAAGPAQRGFGDLVRGLGRMASTHRSSHTGGAVPPPHPATVRREL
ncbi:kelch repeat-containing protein [Streptomyces nojiriensis]